jgi:excisionase family DNA binding protein
MAATPFGRLAYSLPEACEIANIGRTKGYEDIANGKLKARKNGRRTQILADDLRAYVESLPVIEPRADYKKLGAAPVAAKAGTSERRGAAKRRRERLASRGSPAPPGE